MQELRGTTVILRRLSYEYISVYSSAFSPIIQHSLHATLEGELAFVCHAIENHQNHFFYTIFTQAQLFVGAVIIHVHASQYLLYGWIDEHFWGQQLYQDAVCTLASYFFTCTGSTLLYAYVDCQNKPGYHALKKCGFADSAVRNGPFGKQYVMVLRRQVITELFYTHTLCLSTRE